jgi:RHS repeat-associated protein
VTSKSQHFLINQGSYSWQPYTTSATYNLAGMMTSQTYPSGRTVNYAYDDAGKTTSFTGNLGDSVSRNYSTQMAYLPAGQLTKELFGTTTPLYQRLNYNTRQQLYAVRVGTYNGTTYDDNPQAAQSSQTSSWDRGMLTWRYGSDDATTWGAGGSDNNGNVLRAEHWIPGANSYYDDYLYDNLNRLTRVTEGGNASFVQAFDYDQWGNRTINQSLTTTSADVNKKLFTVNTTNNRLGVPSGQTGTMTYDNVGNLITDSYTNPSAGGAMEYDAENHMTSAVNGAHKYRYNADGKRVRRIISGTGEFWMVYGIGGELVAEYNASTVIPTQANPEKEYGYRNGQMLVMGDTAETVANMQFKWLVQDHLGSTRMEIGKDGAASAVVRHDYLPFGEELQGSLRSGNGYGTVTKTKQKFTGKERDDETGLDYFDARYFASIQGRFTGADPLLSSGNPLNPQSWNRYTYALNNPITNVDILGLYAWGAGITEGFKKQFKTWLDEVRKARDSYDSNSEEYKALQAALTYYGEDNGQGPEIRIATTTPGGAATEGKSVYEGKFKDGKLVGSSVTFSPSGIGKNPAEVVAHEGRHGADEKAFHDAVKIVNGKRIISDALDLTRFQMEDRGFEAGQLTAKGLKREYSLYVPDNSEPTVPDLQKDHFLYNPSWANTDRQALQVSRREYLQIEYKLSEQNQGGKLSERK